MATSGWRGDRTLVDLLGNEPQRFHFLQAVRLVAALRAGLQPGAEQRGGDGMPTDPVLQFRSSLTAAFPASDIDDLKLTGDDAAPSIMTVNFLGLGGALGPLPPPIADLVASRARRGDTAARDFLDLFNHRLIEIYVRLHRAATPALQHHRPEHSQTARILFVLLGLGTDGLRRGQVRPFANRLDGLDRSLLAVAGLAHRRPLSLHALEKLLRHHFDVPVRGIPLEGRWLRLDESQRTRLGAAGQNAALGVDAVLGCRIWSQDTALRLEIGPLSLERYCELLPGGRAHPALRKLLRFLLPPSCDVLLRLLLRGDQVPGTVLDRRGSSRLGRTSWLRSRPADAVASLDLFIDFDQDGARPASSTDAAGGNGRGTRAEGFPEHG